MKEIITIITLCYSLAFHASVHAQLLADSRADYSSTQGQGNWFYGYYSNPPSVSSFILFDAYDTTIGNWHRAVGVPPYILLWRDGGHSSTWTLSAWAVRRWVSPSSGIIVIDGFVAKRDPGGGDGVTASIYVNGSRQLSQNVASNDTIGKAINLRTSVTNGSIVDFVIEPGVTDEYDSTAFYATIRAVIPGWPAIVQQPRDAIVLPGSEARFTVFAEGASPLKFQWQFSGGNMDGETNSTLVVSSVAAANLGAYKVVVSNSVGSVTSEPAFLYFPDIKRGLVAWYPFDGNANDASGNTNHGSVAGALLAADPCGGANRTYGFDGLDDRIEASGRSLPSGNSARTITAWIKPEDHEDIYGILDYPVNPNGGPGLKSGFGRRQDRLYFWGGGGGGLFGDAVGYQSDLILPVNQWSFVAVTYSENSLHVWVNSSSEATNWPALNTPLGGLSMGAGNVGSFADNEFFKGAIDDVRIYNRALANLEIDVLYSSNRVPVVLQQPVSASVTEEADVLFQVTADYPGPLSYQWQHDGVDLVGQTNATLLLVDVNTNQAGTYRVLVRNGTCASPSEPALLTVTPVLTLPAGLDATTLFWRTDGNRSWIGQTSVTHDGVDAAQSGAISHNQESWIETTVVGPGTVTFWWRVSSESGFDKYRFYVGENPHATNSGEVAWQQMSVNVPAGEQTLRWVYSKDGSGSVGQDRAWLDQVIYTPNPGVDQLFYVLAKRQFPDGRFKLTFVGTADQRYTIEASTNLANWAQLDTLTNRFGTFPFVDIEAAEFPRRFYRAVEAP